LGWLIPAELTEPATAARLTAVSLFLPCFSSSLHPSLAPQAHRECTGNLLNVAHTAYASDASLIWYKVIRTDGKVLLTGSAANNNYLQAADALTQKGVFAIGIVEATRPIDFGNGMLTSEFQKVRVSVYSTSNGQRLYDTQSPSGSVDRQSFALSESGEQLAILSGDNISLYKVGEISHRPR